MKSRMRIRTWWLLAALTMVCLPTSSSFAADTPEFHLARFVVATVSDCEVQSSDLFKKAAGNVTKLQLLLAKSPKDNECAQAVKAEIMLAMKVAEYLQNHGIAAIFHLEEIDDLKQQLGKARPAHGGDPFLVECVMTASNSNTNQLDVLCTATSLHGEGVIPKSWHHQKPPLDQLVDLFCVDTSENVDELCKNVQKRARR